MPARLVATSTNPSHARSHGFGAFAPVTAVWAPVTARLGNLGSHDADHNQPLTHGLTAPGVALGLKP
jgi:hypothetical protein